MIENGVDGLEFISAGKSSLIKLLYGVYFPDQGQISYAGAPYAPRSPLDAIRSGIHTVYQEFNLLSYLSVAENILADLLNIRKYRQLP